MLQPPDATLSPPLALRDSCQILRELIEVYETSLVDPADRLADADFAKLLEKAVDPAVEMCERMAELRKGATSWDKDIFLINCLGYLQHTLAAYGFTKERVEILEARMHQHVESMTFEHVSNLNALGFPRESTDTSPAWQIARTMWTCTNNEDYTYPTCGCKSPSMINRIG